MTPKMKRFTEKNRQFKVIEAERLTNKGQPIKSKQDLENSDRARYKFEDGSVITLKTTDKQSAPDFTPEWKF